MVIFSCGFVMTPSMVMVTSLSFSHVGSLTSAGPGTLTT